MHYSVYMWLFLLFYILCPSYSTHYQRVQKFFHIILTVLYIKVPQWSTKKINELTYIPKNAQRLIPSSSATAAVKEQTLN